MAGGSFTAITATVTVRVACAGSPIGLSNGDDFTCAVFDSGFVRCWGRNDRGQLGLGDTLDRGDAPGEMGVNLPPVDLGAGARAVAVVAGQQHACALLADGGVKCWGANGFGRLGLGDTANRGDNPGEMGDALRAIRTVELDSVGVVVAKDAVRLPDLAFVVPTDDVFWSAVSRDPVPDERRRAFTFHFKPGLDRAARLRRISEVLELDQAAFEVIEERHAVLPAPGRDHAAAVDALDRALAGTGLALTGNFFAGLAIEDCVARSKAEWRRVAGPPDRPDASATDASSA